MNHETHEMKERLEKTFRVFRVFRGLTIGDLDESHHRKSFAIIESLMMQRMSENDEIVTRYMDDNSFQTTVFPILAREIYKGILEREASTEITL